MSRDTGDQEDLGGDESGGASIVPQTGYLELKDSAGHAEMAVVSAEEVGVRVSVGGLEHLGLQETCTGLQGNNAGSTRRHVQGTQVLNVCCRECHPFLRLVCLLEFIFATTRRKEALKRMVVRPRFRFAYITGLTYVFSIFCSAGEACGRLRADHKLG